MILQDQASVPSVGETLFERIIRYLNTPFIEQKGFSLSIVSLILLVVVICISALISRYARSLLQKRVLPKFHLDPGLQYTLLRLVHYLVITLGVLYAVKVGFSIDLTSVAVIVGFLSVGIGFGLQYIAADIASGFILLFERPVRVGDRVRLDDGIEGQVEKLSLRSTIIVTNENMTVIIPNSKLVQNKLVNYSRGTNVRLNIPVGVAYGSDLEKVSAALLEAAASVKEVLTSPAPRVHFAAFRDSSLDFEIRVWIDAPHRHPQIRSAVHFAIERIFRDYKIEIPFSQHDIRLRSGSLSIGHDESGITNIKVNRDDS
ncbi:MAG: mechanosensitive ion channel domain-containing protein [Blastocatellia bacterium]